VQIHIETSIKTNGCRRGGFYGPMGLGRTVLKQEWRGLVHRGVNEVSKCTVYGFTSEPRADVHLLQSLINVHSFFNFAERLKLHTIKCIERGRIIMSGQL